MSEHPAWDMPPPPHYSSSTTAPTVDALLPSDQQATSTRASASSPFLPSHDYPAVPLARQAASAASSSISAPTSTAAAAAAILPFQPRSCLHTPPLSNLRTTVRPSGSHSEDWLNRSAATNSRPRRDAFFALGNYFDPLTSEDEDDENSVPSAQTQTHDRRPLNLDDVTRSHPLPPPTWFAHDDYDDEVDEEQEDENSSNDEEYEDEESAQAPPMLPPTPPNHTGTRGREDHEGWSWPARPPPPQPLYCPRQRSVVDLTGSSPATFRGGEASLAAGPPETQTPLHGLKRRTTTEPNTASQSSGPNNNKRAKPNTPEQQQQPPHSPIPELDLTSENSLPLPPPPPAPSIGPLKIGQRTCIICMEPYTNASVTPCGHMYCHECLTRALKAGERNSERGVGTCPVCRKTVRRRRGGGGLLALAFMRRGVFRKG